MGAYNSYRGKSVLLPSPPLREAIRCEIFNKCSLAIVSCTAWTALSNLPLICFRMIFLILLLGLTHGAKLSGGISLINLRNCLMMGPLFVTILMGVYVGW